MQVPIYSEIDCHEETVESGYSMTRLKEAMETIQEITLVYNLITIIHNTTILHFLDLALKPFYITLLYIKK